MSSNGIKRKNRQYTDEALSQALEEVRVGRMSRNEASKTFKIPPSTLFNKLNQTNENRPAGRPTILSAAEEAEIAEWITHCATIGDPRCRAEIIESAAKLAKLREGEVFGESGKISSRKLLMKLLILKILI